VILDREAADAICFLARENPETLVFMATHGRGGLRGTVMGSVGEAVVREVHRPLVLVGPHGRLGESSRRTSW
jgi:nucleotide-binding universal stress UspA family protein